MGDEAPVGVEVEGGVGELPVEPKYKNLTLFVGLPLRTKRGKEVLLAVQSVVNKLEAYGYPVHRYHSDRAKELRSAILLVWIKNKGAARDVYRWRISGWKSRRGCCAIPEGQYQETVEHCFYTSPVLADSLVARFCPKLG